MKWIRRIAPGVRQRGAPFLFLRTMREGAVRPACGGEIMCECIAAAVFLGRERFREFRGVQSVRIGAGAE